MKRLIYALLILSTVGVLAGSSSFGVRASPPPPRTLSGQTPDVVVHGKAQLHGHHNPNDVLTLNVGLAVHDSAGLDALIKAASTPGSPQYGHYLTNAQYMARYAPTGAEVQAARTWLAGQGLQVTGVSPDNLLVHVRAAVQDAERAFGVTINDYSYNGRTFHANDRDPSVPAGLSISAISGLSDFDVYRVASRPAITCVTPPNTGCGLDGGDFRTAYDISGNGNGQTIGFTLWGQELPQSDFTGYANATGTTAITVGQAGNDGLNWVQVDGSTTESDTDREVALDTEVAHAVAPGSHLTYWLGHDSQSTTLEDVINDAANSNVPIISNSWECDGCAIDANDETSLQHGVSTGKTFYFSSGDNGAAGKNSKGRSYPAVSQYVVAVGGTSLTLGAGSAWSSETAWSSSGGGCDNGESRPSWQTGIGSPQVYGTPPTACTGRAEPDVAADSSTGAFLYFDGAANCCTIGTSLSAPLWAAMSTIWNNNNAASGRPGLGFSAPLIYALANDATTYANDFHDITSGNNGFAAGTGWDEATGWGSPDFNKLSNNLADITYTGPSSASKGDTITLSATLLDHNASTALATTALGGRTVTFAAGLESCTATTDASGNASCPVTIGDAPGHYSVIAVFAGDAAYKAVSVTLPFTVLHIPTTVTYTGATSGDYNDPVTLSATLTDNSNSQGIANETLSFNLGAESCSAKTDTSGKASCQVTPLDTPGAYTVQVSFGGDEPVYEPSSANSPFTLNKEESKVTYTGPLTVHYHDPVTVSAQLTDPDGGAPIAGKQITFTLGVSDTCSATTDASGNASCAITPHQTGTQNLVASFAGDVDYLSSSDTKSFSITPEETTMAYTGPKVILAGSGGATLTAKLVEDGANDNDGDGGSPGPIPAQTVTLSLGSQSCTGTTDASGNVSCTIPSVSVPLGPETVGASFAGNAYYQPSSDSATAIVFAFPSRGAFVLGDKTVAGAGSSTVTWWGDTWWQLNSLTGGTAPPAFKGFAGVITLPTTSPPTSCGSAWTTTTGNSPPPVSGVPSYMGVVVASSVTMSGSTVSGNSVHIVVVKVNPGYAPNPMSYGTGTIVATFC